MIRDRSIHYLLAQYVAHVVGPFPSNLYVTPPAEEGHEPSILVVWAFGTAHHVMIEAHYDRGPLMWDHGFFTPGQSVVEEGGPELETLVPALQEFFAQCGEPLLPFGSGLESALKNTVWIATSLTNSTLLLPMPGPFL